MADESLVAFLSSGGSLTQVSPSNPLPTTGGGGGGSSTVTLAAGTAQVGTVALATGGTVTVLGAGTAGTLPVAVPPVAYSSSGSSSVGTTSGTLATAGQFKFALQIATLPASTANIWLNPTGGAAVVGSGLLLSAGGGSINFGAQALPMPTAAITAITDGASSQNVALAGA
jgi:hypothetical protein